MYCLPFSQVRLATDECQGRRMPREVGIRMSNVVQKLERPIAPSYEADITKLYIAGREEGVAEVEY